MMEKPKHAEVLLQYGAKFWVENEYGQTPGKLLPRDVVPSVRLAFKRLFEDASRQYQNQLGSVEHGSEM
jgi:hypothetical protein